MTRIFITGALLLTMMVFLVVAGCDKEKIVETTEYIHDVEYVELPADTVFVNDSVHTTDTLILYDTVVQVEQVFDTVFVHDTVTNVIVDTVLNNQCTPNEFLAMGALEYYTDPLVLEFINAEFGYSDGWIFYLSAFQSEFTKQSANVFDLYGYIDYWTPDWSGFYALEYYWRLTFTGGDPANPNNWQMSEPPGGVSGYQNGVSLTQDPSRKDAIQR
jgi:hypothetical protein